MGLGKTLQALSLAYLYRDEWPLLIIVPASLKFQWVDEIERWFPEIQPNQINFIEHGADISEICKCQITIVTYGILRNQSSQIVQEALSNQNFKAIILDESHFMKGRKTSTANFLVPLLKKSNRCILLTGTPALNCPQELFTQLEALCPNLFSSWYNFSKKFCDAKFKYFGRIKRWDTSGACNIDVLENLLKNTVMIRRLKKDVLSQLPSKQRHKISFKLPESTIKKELEREMDKFRSMILKNNLTLSDLSDRYLDSNIDCKNTQRISFLETLNIVVKLTYQAKSGAIKEHLKMLCEDKSLKMLVFAHHKEVMQMLSELFIELKVDFIKIDGSVKISERPHLVKIFQEDDATRIALLSMRAAGVGLTLTAASLVVFVELDWSPCLLQQCEDRAHRIGQQNCVTVQYLVARNTIEDLMWSKLNKKIHVLSSTLDGVGIHFEAERGSQEVEDRLANVIEKQVTAEPKLDIIVAVKCCGQKTLNEFFTSSQKQSQESSKNSSSEDIIISSDDDNQDKDNLISSLYKNTTSGGSININNCGANQSISSLDSDNDDFQIFSKKFNFLKDTKINHNDNTPPTKKLKIDSELINCSKTFKSIKNVKNKELDHSAIKIDTKNLNINKNYTKKIHIDEKKKFEKFSINSYGGDNWHAENIDLENDKQLMLEKEINKKNNLKNENLNEFSKDNEMYNLSLNIPINDQNTKFIDIKSNCTNTNNELITENLITNSKDNTFYFQNDLVNESVEEENRSICDLITNKDISLLNNNFFNDFKISSNHKYESLEVNELGSATEKEYDSVGSFDIEVFAKDLLFNDIEILNDDKNKKEYKCLKFLCSRITGRFYIYDDEGHALNETFFPIDIECGDFSELTSLYKQESHLKFIRTFVDEWNQLSSMKQRMLMNFQEPFVSPLETYEAIRTKISSKNRYTLNSNSRLALVKEVLKTGGKIKGVSSGTVKHNQSNNAQNDLNLTIFNDFSNTCKNLSNRDIVENSSISGEATDTNSIVDKNYLQSITNIEIGDSDNCVSINLKDLSEEQIANSFNGLIQAWDNDGNKLCLHCQTSFQSNNLISNSSSRLEILATSFCNKKCFDNFSIKRDGNYLINCVFVVEHGVCQICSFDAHSFFLKLSGVSKLELRAKLLKDSPYNKLPIEMRKKIIANPQQGLFWNVDHMRAVSEGGGECGLDNVRTLCVPCHRKVTQAQAKTRNQQKKLPNIGCQNISQFFTQKS